MWQGSLFALESYTTYFSEKKSTLKYSESMFNITINFIQKVPPLNEAINSDSA